MGWRVSSPTYYIAPGQTVRIGFWWKAPGDRGAQWAMGHPIDGQSEAALATERVAKVVSCQFDSLSQNAGVHFYECSDPGTIFWTYYVDIKNDNQAKAASFELEGGGV